MRDRPLRLLTHCALLCASLAAAPTQADAPAPLQVRILPVGTLQPEARQAIELEVLLTPDGGAPLLLTPSTEGNAVEVVRGRLLRSDAVDPDARPLRFRLPIVARSAGTSILRIEVAGFSCAERCRPVRGSSSLVLRVSGS